MSVPEHLLRHPTREAIETLAKRFGLPNSPSMQDWEWEVADSSRIGEFLSAYESGVLTDDERFTLMEMIIQSIEDKPGSIDSDPDWKRTLRLLDKHIQIHLCTVWYWAESEKSVEEETWRVAPSLRLLLTKHEALYKETPAS